MVYDLKKEEFQKARVYERAAGLELEREHPDYMRAISSLGKAIGVYESLKSSEEVARLKRQISNLEEKRPAIVRTPRLPVLDLDRFMRGARVAASIMTISLGLLFLSLNITGNVIGSMSNLTSNITGAAFILVGLLLGFFCVRKK